MIIESDAQEGRRLEEQSDKKTSGYAFWLIGKVLLAKIKAKTFNISNICIHVIKH